ncbi:MAG: hypothetical protein KUG77_27115 [Nannocystaceae bacterium]|nr:hypothetical protein [Nannocystaceae bacterium]
MPDVVNVDLVDRVIVVRYDGRPDEVAFQKYLDQYTQLVTRGVPYATVYATMLTARMPTPREIRMQANWMKEYRDVAGQLCRGLAFHLPSPVMRGVLRGVLAIQPLGAKHMVVDSLDGAMSWANEQLDQAA